MSESKPALTPEEWMDHVRIRGCGDALSDTADAWYPPDPDGDPVEAMDQSLERVAAIALHRGPRPFTWEDVDLELSRAEELRSLIDVRRHNLSDPHVGGTYSERGEIGTLNAIREMEEEMQARRSLADRIAALLPPRGE